MTLLKLDLHVHTIYSKDAFIKPEKLLETLLSKGLDGCALCDHESLKAYDFLKDDAAKKNLVLIPGMEIETNIGEIIGLFLNNPITFEKKENFFHVVSKIKNAGGLVVIPHPFDFLRRNRLKLDLLSEKILGKYIDGIEVMNSRILVSRSIDLAKQLQKKHDLIEVGGSDAHTLREIGNGYTIFRNVEEKSLKVIKEALLSKESFSYGKTCSPYVHMKTILKKILNRMYF